MASIQIRSIEVYGHHGVFEQERQQGQFFKIDLKLKLREMPKRDELSETVDYAEVIEEVRILSEKKSYNLLECFAQAIGKQLLEKFDRLEMVDVRVRKRLRGAGADLDWVAVRVEVLREKDMRRE
ncbi:dihydroneopterin aldolase [Candidatus Acetothermia bacterium]|nr:dihydroneopterin aldolase [Candidatus Acetothermia bacterium]MBI3642955.1 dihydroneopterin aldolase [Candidatus Acetothermia bacterium]